MVLGIRLPSALKGGDTIGFSRPGRVAAQPATQVTGAQASFLRCGTQHNTWKNSALRADQVLHSYQLMVSEQVSTQQAALSVIMKTLLLPEGDVIYGLHLARIVAI
jgi:hypothetical protein